jgi:hypothetical protein
MGYRIMQAMGWQEGRGLGPEQDGKVDPIQVYIDSKFLLFNSIQ